MHRGAFGIRRTLPAKRRAEAKAWRLASAGRLCGNSIGEMTQKRG